MKQERNERLPIIQADIQGEETYGDLLAKRGFKKAIVEAPGKKPLKVTIVSEHHGRPFVHVN